MGKTRTNFGAECFELHKLGKYNQCLVDYERGTPVLYFVVLPVRRGPRNAAHIDELESFLSFRRGWASILNSLTSRERNAKSGVSAVSLVLVKDVPRPSP